MVVTRVGPLSIARITGTLYAMMGVIIGAVVSLFSIVGAFALPSDQGMFGAIFGAAAIVLFPLLYGVLGFLSTLLMAWLYNLVAGMVGGIELDLQ